MIEQFLIVQSTLNLWYAKGMLMIFLLFSSKEHQQRFVDYIRKPQKYKKFTSETDILTLFGF